MSHPDLVSDTFANCLDDDAVPDDPFTSLRFHFGMLLGVDDFETEQSYHRAQTRLHQSWLHGAGVIWGFGVSLDQARNEVRVERGLACDGAGRVLHLDGPACLDPGAWLDRHDAEVPRIDPPPEGADTAFDAHVEARWSSCLTRPVPALAEPCDNAGIETAYSRVWETVELRLVPGLADEPPARYRRVRILLGLLAPGENPGDAEAAQARADVLAAADADRTATALAAFRAQANLDALALAPPDSGDGAAVLTAAAPPAPVVLANLPGVALRRNADDDGWTLVGGTVDLLPRRSHVATETVQELTVAALAGAGAGAGSQFAEVGLDGAELRLTFAVALDPRTVKPAAFAVSVLGDDGWSEIAVDDATADGDTAAVLKLGDKPAPPWQVIAHGTGPAPLLGAGLAPLRDFVHLERS